MPPIISVVGKSDSGKTTLLEALIKVLKQRGYRIAVIKHAVDGFELDTPNKDSWRFSQAGSEVAAISSKDTLAIFRHLENDMDPQELVQYTGADCDLVLTEGFKRSPYPKIEVIRGEQGSEPVSPPEQLLAMVTDKPLNINVPQFTREKIAEIADLIEQKYLVGAEDSIDLYVDGTYVPLDKAGRNLLLRTLVAIVSGLKEIHRWRRLSVFMRRKS
ncbi:MAG TPA: molybdopterin-guanine dinucleotide biosynthesis protein B [Dehalococcoidales bacterium]|nr:molybdopterin-guanine dinucleotide biosynthesis protein B [Dehalococcoidales bacterium]